MARLAEAIELFREDFKIGAKLKDISERGLQELPEEWQTFYKEVGIVSRKDGFLWIIDPADYLWLFDVFGDDIILGAEFTPVARNSFGDFYLIDRKGVLYSFLPQYGQLDRASSNALLSIVALSEKSVTDDGPTLTRHKRQQKLGNVTDYDTCYCLRPTISLGGCEETSEVYVGGIRAYMAVVAAALS